MDFLFYSKPLPRPFQARKKIEIKPRRRRVMSKQNVIRPP